MVQPEKVQIYSRCVKPTIICRNLIISIHLHSIKFSKFLDMTKLNQKWYNINWNKTSKYVKKLQKELVVAYKNNDQNLHFFLQEKPVMSFEG